MAMAGLLGMRQVINHHFGRAKDLLTPPVTALENLEDGVVGVGGIVALGNRFMPVRVERLANALLGLDTMLAEQQAQLLQRHFHPLMKLWGAGGCTGGQSTFEVVDCGQQFMDKRFLLRGRTGLALLAAAPLEILEIRGQAQLQICLFGELSRSESESVATASAVKALASDPADGGFWTLGFMG
jgi:hypothetical protein